MIRLFRLSCQQRFRVGLHLGQHNRDIHARARARTHARTYRRTRHSLSRLSRRPRRRRSRRRRRRRRRVVSLSSLFPAVTSAVYRKRNAGHTARTTQYALYAPRSSNHRAPFTSRDPASFKVIGVLVRSHINTHSCKCRCYG